MYMFLSALLYMLCPRDLRMTSNNALYVWAFLAKLILILNKTMLNQNSKYPAKKQSNFVNVSAGVIVEAPVISRSLLFM